MLAPLPAGDRQAVHRGLLQAQGQLLAGAVFQEELVEVDDADGNRQALEVSSRLLDLLVDLLRQGPRFRGAGLRQVVAEHGAAELEDHVGFPARPAPGRSAGRRPPRAGPRPRRRGRSRSLMPTMSSSLTASKAAFLSWSLARANSSGSCRRRRCSSGRPVSGSRRNRSEAEAGCGPAGLDIFFNLGKPEAGIQGAGRVWAA